MNGFRLFEPQASTVELPVDLLFFAMLGLCAVVAIGVVLAMSIFAVRYRRGSAADRTEAKRESFAIEGTWTVVVLVLFLLLFIWAQVVVKDAAGNVVSPYLYLSAQTNNTGIPNFGVPGGDPTAFVGTQTAATNTYPLGSDASGFPSGIPCDNGVDPSCVALRFFSRGPGRWPAVRPTAPASSPRARAVFRPEPCRSGTRAVPSAARARRASSARSSS